MDIRRCENAKFTLAAPLRYFLHLAPGTRFLVLLVDESKAAVAVAPSLNYRLLQIPIDFVFSSAREGINSALYAVVHNGSGKIKMTLHVWLHCIVPPNQNN